MFFKDNDSSDEDLQYVVLEVVLQQRVIGVGSINLSELEKTINKQAKKGYRLHTLTTANEGDRGPGGGPRVSAIMVFEKII